MYINLRLFFLKAMYCNQTVHFWLEVSLCINSCMQLLYDYTNLMMVIMQNLEKN